MHLNKVRLKSNLIMQNPNLGSKQIIDLFIIKIIATVPPKFVDEHRRRAACFVLL